MTTGKERLSQDTWQIYRRLLTYTARYWPVGMVAVLSMAVDAGCMALFASLMKPIVDKLFVHRDPHAVFWMPIWILGIFTVRGFASYGGDYGMAYMGRNVVQTIRIEVFEAYLRMTEGFFAQERSGNLISRITYTTEQVAQAATDAIKTFVLDGLSVIFYICVMLYYSPYLTISLLVMVLPMSIVATMVSRRFRRISRQIQSMMGSVASNVEEVVTGSRDIKIYGGRGYERTRFVDIAERARKLNLKVTSTNGISSSIVQLLAAAALATILFLATEPRLASGMTPGTFLAVMSAMAAILPSLKRLTGVQANMQRGIAAAGDLFEILDIEGEQDRGTHQFERSLGDLRFDAISLTYPGAREQALRGIDLRCRPGTVTALVGRSGSGKSSLINLLPRFYEPDAGQVVLDGRNIREYSLDALRCQIAWVGQSVVLFDDTVANNIAYGELAGASEADIIEAAKAANAMEFISRMPHGLHTKIGERGNQLSGGQRQRIAIARAVLKNATILVLDEATSALDVESERLIQQALSRLMRNRTTLVIAHRLATIEGADQIVVMDQGRVVERGTHCDLLALDGHYASLHRMQFRDAAAIRDVARNDVMSAPCS